MNKIQHISQNATLNSTEMINLISSNIYGYIHNGHRAKRYRFSDFMTGGDIKDAGFLWSQGKQEPRLGEWTKVMINGRGLFSVQDPKTQDIYYTRLGDFHIDAGGNLVTAEGYQVQAIPLAGMGTRLQGPDMGEVGFQSVNPNWVDPFNNPYTNNAQYIHPSGQAVGDLQKVNLALDPSNAKYLGQYSQIKIGDDGVIYGKEGNHIISLYKLAVVDFNNLDGLRDVKDGIFFKATDQSGLPSLKQSPEIISEALEKSNVWVKVEAHTLTDAQRYFQAATQIHKLADKITGTSIEMIQ